MRVQARPRVHLCVRVPAHVCVHREAQTEVSSSRAYPHRTLDSGISSPVLVYVHCATHNSKCDWILMFLLQTVELRCGDFFCITHWPEADRCEALGILTCHPGLLRGGFPPQPQPRPLWPRTRVSLLLLGIHNPSALLLESRSYHKGPIGPHCLPSTPSSGPGSHCRHQGTLSPSWEMHRTTAWERRPWDPGVRSGSSPSPPTGDPGLSRHRRPPRRGSWPPQL